MVAVVVCVAVCLMPVPTYIKPGTEVTDTDPYLS